MKEEIQNELTQLQRQMALAVEEGDVTLAYDLEKRIDELQQALLRLQAQ